MIQGKSIIGSAELGWEDLAKAYGIDESRCSVLVKSVDAWLESRFNDAVISKEYVDPMELSKLCVQDMLFDNDNEVLFSFFVACIYTYSNVILRTIHESTQQINNLNTLLGIVKV